MKIITFKCRSFIPVAIEVSRRTHVRTHVRAREFLCFPIFHNRLWDSLEIRSSLKRILAGMWWVWASHTGSLDTAVSIRLQFSLRNLNSHDKNDGYTWPETWKTRAWILELKWALLEILVWESSFYRQICLKSSLPVNNLKFKRIYMKNQRKQRLNSVA